MTDIVDTIARIRLPQSSGPTVDVTAPARVVALVVDRSRLRRFDVELVSRLRSAGIRVSVCFGRSRMPLPTSVSLLLEFERLAYRLRGPLLAERASMDDLGPPDLSANGSADLIVDLCDDQEAHGARPALRVLYDGALGEAALIAALVDGRMPAIEIEDSRDHAMLARGIACADNAGTLSEAIECVLARVLVLVVAAVRGDRPLAPARLPSHHAGRGIAAFAVKALASAAVSRLYHLCCHAPHWRTLWRFVHGVDLWDTKTLRGTSWHVIPDPGHRFYADPFPFEHEGQTFVFVEDLDHRTRKGVISVIPFDGDGPTARARPVLEEPWHLSYPFLIAHEGQVWMVPESSANATVTLYRADPFPDRWVPEATLLTGVEASDATIVRHGGLFWMFAATRDGRGSWSDTLSIWWARDLRGPWTAHAASPALIDQAAARPAGAMVVRDGRLWRPVQDCTQGYGTGIGLAEVTVLDREYFRQRVDAVLHAEPHWPGRRFHTLNRAGQIECIDGAAYSAKSRMMARWFEDRSGLREEPRSWR